MNCVRKKSKKGGEGLIRGDAGVREEKEISNWYHCRSICTFTEYQGIFETWIEIRTPSSFPGHSCDRDDDSFVGCNTHSPQVRLPFVILHFPLLVNLTFLAFKERFWIMLSKPTRTHSCSILNTTLALLRRWLYLVREATFKSILIFQAPFEKSALDLSVERWPSPFETISLLP